jgi:hypothetical protein
MKTITKIFFALPLFFLASCSANNSGCDQWAKDFKDNTELHIVLVKFERNGKMIYLYGKNTQTGKSITFREDGGWLESIYKKLDVGDTIIKEKGSYMTIVKKTSYVVKTPLKCEETGQEYTDK